MVFNTSLAFTQPKLAHMPLHALSLFKERGRLRQQQFRGYSQKLDVFKFMEASWIYSRVLKELVCMYISLLSKIYEKLWKLGEVFDNSKKAIISLLEKARMIPSALTQFVERSWSLPLGVNFQAHKGQDTINTDLPMANCV